MTVSGHGSPPSVAFGFMKLVVADLDGAIDFYGRAFGLVPAQVIENLNMKEVILQRAGKSGGFSLVLYHHKDGREISIGTGYGPLGLFVRDLEQAYEHALAEGARPSRPAIDTGAMRAAFVLDPEGHEIELVSVAS